MLYRDDMLVRQRVQATEREIRDAAAVAACKAATVAPRVAGRGLRATSAGTVRRLGRAVLAVSDRMDAGPKERAQGRGPAGAPLSPRRHA